MRPKTFYCNTDCQKAGWAIHKTLCNHLRRQKRLYRAARLIQDAFYTYRRRMYDVSIARIERKGSAIHVWEGPYGLTQCLVPFPNHLILGKEEEESLLSYLTCSDALTCMYDLKRQLLDGMLAWKLACPSVV